MRRSAAVLAALAAAVPAAPAAASTFRAPIDPPTIDPGCDYGSTTCAVPGRYHTGIDYLGDDPPHEVVRAAADGIVRVAAPIAKSHGFGNAVILEHHLPDGSRVYTVYGHMAKRPTVEVGQCVSRGSSLGIQGDTGDTGDTENVSLHFEVKRDPKFGPPYGYSRGPPGGYRYFDPKSFIGKRKAKDVCAPPKLRCAGALTISAPSSGAKLSRQSLRVAGSSERGSRVAGCAVGLALRRTLSDGCSWWRPKGDPVRRACDSPRWFKATKVRAKRSRGVWSYRFPRALTAGRYVLLVRIPGGPHAVAHFKLPK